MANLTDLPAELVHQIIDHILLLRANQPYCATSRRISNDELHHKPNHIKGLKPIDSRPPRVPIHQKTDFYSRWLENDYERAPSSLRQVSWPECLPSNPYLALSLVGRTFRQCAQERLFKDVVLKDRWQAYLFHQSLTCCLSQSTRAPIVNLQAGKRSIREDKVPPLAQHVRTLQFMWTGSCSMGKGGGSLICEIIQCCPSLENLVISNPLLHSCKEPIYQALAARKSIKEFVILQDPYSKSFQWRVEEVVGRLFAHWDRLETVDFHRLSGRPSSRALTIPEEPAVLRSIPIINPNLRTMILTQPDLDEKQFELLLKSSQESLRTLEIINPTERLSRAGLCRILQEATSPDLESLRIEVETWWHPIERTYARTYGSESLGSMVERLYDDGSDGQGSRVEGSYDEGLAGGEGLDNLEGSVVEELGDEGPDVEEGAEGSDGEGLDPEDSDDPAINPNLLDIVFSSQKALRKLKCLSFTGELASPMFFDLLPQSLVKLAWEHCNMEPTVLADRLSSPIESEHSLPHLLCCSVRIRYCWNEADRQTIQRVLKARGGCLHQSIDDSYGQAETESQEEREALESESIDHKIARTSSHFYHDRRDVWDG
ncbi:hypothetical protein PGT21_016768 [Puccinia graminis f. sp. tritici]|uniref:Uncharacterized protein n=1 Tax=Puccinia graminis f. sp. tritici TaxID=56615 RepID=A0A5B0R0U2_PUCGR|nr:hypothetical protein PGT21_016768 [Puccinia graminis f. sp. tritici]